MQPGSEQLLISAHPFETRLAVLADRRLLELHATPTDGESAVGLIALGKVVRVLPGMQAAFVELGLERPGFLHARDIERVRVSAAGETIEAPDIRKLVHEGQVLPVQVAKDPLASKGARLTTNLSLPSRFLVLTPNSEHIGVSQRITDTVERDRLRDLVRECALAAGMPVGHGFIVRTAAEGGSRDDFAADVAALALLWKDVERRRIAASTGGVLFRDLPTHIRVLRDLVGPMTASIRVDSAQLYAAVSEFIATTLPNYTHIVQLVESPEPLFLAHGVEQQIRSALKPRVGLPSGGYLIIEQTEAMITIDVNTGGFTGSSSLEETVYQTNLEAAAVLPRQLRLRNLGGLVVVDFIDMEVEEHRNAVIKALRDGCSGDPARVRLSPMSEFGLVELSRKRTRESLARQFCQPCAVCVGSGLVPRPATVAFEVLRALSALGKRQRTVATSSQQDIIVVAAEPVILRLLGDDASHLAQIAQTLGVAVQLQANADSAPGAFELL